MCAPRLYLSENLRFPQRRGSDGMALGCCGDYVRRQNKRHPSRQYSWVCRVFICATCVCAHTCEHAPDFSWLLPLLFAKKLGLQRKARERTVERHRGNWSPTTPDLSDGKRRQHLVIASFGISFLPFSLRPFVIIFYNRMSNLPLAERRECLPSPPPPPVTHTCFHSLSYKRQSARYSLALA